jgi:hypothetical protein
MIPIIMYKIVWNKKNAQFDEVVVEKVAYLNYISSFQISFKNYPLQQKT